MSLSRLQALETLFSASAHDRARAARALSKLATNDDQSALRSARFLEKDAYVIRNLERAISNCPSKTKELRPELVHNEDMNEIIKVQRLAAIDWISGLLLHEIGAKIGLIDLYAQKEIQNYSESKTRKNVGYLQSIFEGIEHLRSASAVPKIAEFSLAGLVDEIIDIESEGKAVSISRIGERPAMALSDPGLLSLAISNGVRNGIEAALATKTASCDERFGTSISSTTDVIVSWGTTDTDHWLTVIDNGQGLSDGNRVFDVGATTKTGHVGFGLAIAKQAIDSIDGEIRLFASLGGGATYELRWKRII